MISKDEVKRRLFHMASIFLVTALISMCGFIVVPELIIAEMDPNTLTVIKFLTMTAFLLHIAAMLSMSVLLVGDTMERIIHTKTEDE